MDLRHVALLGALGPLACSPFFSNEPAPQKPEILPPEPVGGDPEKNENGIPWAPGEGPGGTREVGEQPRSTDEPMPEEAFRTTEGDGIVQGSASQRCTGKAPVALRAELQARTAALKVCSDDAPEEFRGDGLLKYTVRVEQDGSVQTIYQLENTLNLEQVQSCVEAKLKERFQEKPLAGCAQFVVPYELKVEEGQNSSPSDEENLDSENTPD